MGLFHRGKKNNDDEPDSVQTNSFSDIMNGLQYAVNCGTRYITESSDTKSDQTF